MNEENLRGYAGNLRMTYERSGHFDSNSLSNQADWDANGSVGGSP